MPEKGRQQDSIKVFLRVRPRVQHELVENHSCKNLSTDQSDPTVVKIRDPRQSNNENAEKRFFFHRVFDQDSAQEAVFDEFAKDAVQDALDGYHGVMFVYGQTGSGKTFTMSHNEKGKEGMLQRSMQAVWKHVAEDPEYDYDLSVSYVQLYNEMLSDMLEPSKDNAVRLSGVAERRSDVKMVNEHTNKGIARPVQSYDETIKAFETGLERRVSSSTNMNAVSSRSHTVFTLYIKKQAKTEKSEQQGATAKVLEGRLVICDLAGSERVKKTEAKGAQLAEANHINGSLLVLGRVVAALTDAKGAQHVPYRESKLTRILQYSLSGWGKTRLVVNVSPSDYNTEETLSAIMFGQRAIQIKQSAEKHETLDYKALYLDLQRQLDKQRDDVLRDAIADFEEQKKRLRLEYEERIELLEAANSVLKQQLAAAGSAGPSGVLSPETSAVVRDAQRHVAAGAGAAAMPADLDTSAQSAEMSPSRMTFEGMDVTEILAKMKQRMETRDRRLEAVETEKQDLREKLAQTEMALLKVASTFKQQKRDWEEKRMGLLQENAELGEKLAQATGVEYLTVQAIDPVDDVKAPLESPRPAGTPATPSTVNAAMHFDPNSSDNAEIERLFAVIKRLQSKLNDAAAYNKTARRAIKLLNSDWLDAKADADALRAKLQSK